MPLLGADIKRVFFGRPSGLAIVKVLTNLFAGRMSDRIGRKRIFVAGWLFGLPVPFLAIFAPAWEWVVFAKVLLGINQGLLLVNDGHHEDRRGRACSARPGDGAQ